MEKIIAILGLTSSGKSDLAILLAKRFNGEIVSCDSRQVYKGLDYCSGKVSKAEQQIVPHHLLDVVSIGEYFSLYDYQRLAYAAIDDILSRGKVPILVGGTGLFARAVTEGYELVDIKPTSENRNALASLSVEELLEICREKNIDTFGELNPRRLIRLIETDGQVSRSSKPRYKCLKMAIAYDRDTIYKRIELRLKKRMPFMFKEIESLLLSGVKKEDLMSLGLEAKCVCEYFDGVYSGFDEFFEELFKQERHYAKRQSTWLNRESDLHWLEAGTDTYFEAVNMVKSFLDESEDSDANRFEK